MCHACTTHSARGIGRPLPERTTMPDLSEIPGLLPRDGDPNTSRRGRLPEQMIPTDVLACFACGWWVTTARVGGILSPRNTCPNCQAHGSKPTRLAPATITVTRKDPS